MDSSEIQKELEMTYFELVEYLLKKYGTAKYDYFCNESCKSKNKKVTRSSEGLYCHHIDEYSAILLSNEAIAKLYPFEYQKADRLVYCNVLEHLILHVKIVEEKYDDKKLLQEGVGGVHFISMQINDYFDGYPIKQEYLKKVYSLIENNLKDYAKVLRYFLNIDGINTTKEHISIGWNGKVVRKVYMNI